MSDIPGYEELVARLRELRALATQGDWQLQDGCSWRRIGTREHNGNVLCPSTYSSTDNHPDLIAGRGEDVYANLRLIVELVNAFPLLATALEQQKAEIEKMKEGLRQAIACMVAAKQDLQLFGAEHPITSEIRVEIHKARSLVGSEVAG